MIQYGNSDQGYIHNFRYWMSNMSIFIVCGTVFYRLQNVKRFKLFENILDDGKRRLWHFKVPTYIFLKRKRISHIKICLFYSLFIIKYVIIFYVLQRVVNRILSNKRIQYSLFSSTHLITNSKYCAKKCWKIREMNENNNDDVWNFMAMNSNKCEITNLLWSMYEWIEDHLHSDVNKFIVNYKFLRFFGAKFHHTF